MLYQSSRSKTDSFTSYRALHEQVAPDGGQFMPFRLPSFSETQICDLKTKSFGQNVAQILNLFFSSELTGWDVDCLIGKNPAGITSMSQRVVVAKLWNNPQSHYRYLEDSLFQKLSAVPGVIPGMWAKLAIRIAILFAVTGELAKIGVEKFDIAVPAGDLEIPVAAWYGKKMGLPIGMIICSCNENSAIWDFIHRGELDTGLPVIQTALPLLDVQNPSGLEHLISGSLGIDETLRYRQSVEQKKTYRIHPEFLPELNKGLFVSVVGQKRTEPVINSVYRSSGLILDPYAAVAYGGLQDYRAKTGESRTTLLISDVSPMEYVNMITRATGLTREEVRKYI